MTLFTEAHYAPEGQPGVAAIVPDSLAVDAVKRYNTMESILKARWEKKYPEQTIGAPLVFACHDRDPDPALSWTDAEREKYFPPAPQASVRMLGTH